jgi:alkylation response protein AidB-like acyl-CoA dehydrogenase
VDFGRVELDHAHQQLLKDVETFAADTVTEEVHEKERLTGDGFNEKVHLALGARGWIMPMWPAEQGGADLDYLGSKILEVQLAKAKVPWITYATTKLVWSAVEKYLDPEVLADVRPKVASGHVRFCLGYSEPDGGSDIANAKVRAVRDGDEWVINGSKIWTTGAQQCQYVFLITRTDPDLPKHKGLTMFLVPLSAPGIEIQAIRTYGNERTNVVFYSDVRISDRYRLGGVNAGWSVLHGPLDEEHSIGAEASDLDDASVSRPFLRELEHALDGAAEWAKTATRPDGSHPADDPSVRMRLGKVAAELEAGLSATGPAGRVLGSEALIHGGAELSDLVGPEALLPAGAEGAVAGGAIDYAHRYAQGTATYGGTVEVFRNIISQHILGLPQLNLPGRRTFLQGKRAEQPAVGVRS